MAKRIKQVFNSNAQLCHVWASETQEKGRANNMFFNGPEIYSYGLHYLAAKIYTNERGEKLALMNECRYSVSTSGHLSDIRSALNGRMRYIEVPNPDDINDQINEETLTIGCHTINIEQAKTVLNASPVLTLVQDAV